MSLIQNLIDWLAPKPDRTWAMDNQIQAQAFSLILQEEGIAHRIRRNGEALLGYVEPIKDAWGWLEADAADADRVEALYRDFLASEAGTPEE